MLNIEDLQYRHLISLQAYNSGSPDAPVLRDEAEAFLTQALDAGLIAPEDTRVIEMSEGLNRLKDSKTTCTPALARLHALFSNHLRRLTQTHTRKSLERYLRSESDSEKRRTAYQSFLQTIDDPAAFSVILQILELRGPQYGQTKAQGLAVKDLSEVESLISRVAATLHLPPLQTMPPWDFFAQMDGNDARAPLAAYTRTAIRMIEKIFAVRLAHVSRPTYHPDVQVFELHDQRGLIGIWHIDLFKRPGKFQGAWTQTALRRRLLPNGRAQTPLVFLGFDLGRDEISFAESRSFLHELGHALEHCLSPDPKHTPDTNEISSMYLESFVTHPDLLSLFPVDASQLRNLRSQQLTVDLARICLTAKMDIEIHRNSYASAAELKQKVSKALLSLDLAHPLVTPETLTVFDHAFADEEYASTYYSYLLSFIFARALQEAHGTQLFWDFWHKDALEFVRQISMETVELTNLAEGKC